MRPEGFVGELVIGLWVRLSGGWYFQLQEMLKGRIVFE